MWKQDFFFLPSVLLNAKQLSKWKDFENSECSGKKKIQRDRHLFSWPEQTVSRWRGAASGIGRQLWRILYEQWQRNTRQFYPNHGALGRPGAPSTSSCSSRRTMVGLSKGKEFSNKASIALHWMLPQPALAPFILGLKMTTSLKWLLSVHAMPSQVVAAIQPLTTLGCVI